MRGDGMRWVMSNGGAVMGVIFFKREKLRIVSTNPYKGCTPRNAHWPRR